jgi:hypothetical protein
MGDEDGEDDVMKMMMRGKRRRTEPEKSLGIHEQGMNSLE